MRGKDADRCDLQWLRIFEDLNRFTSFIPAKSPFVRIIIKAAANSYYHNCKSNKESSTERSRYQYVQANETATLPKENIMQKIEDLLPLGSIVMLNGGQKRLMIYGVMQTEQTTNTQYDYIGVLYPEGSMGKGTQYLFNNDQIKQVFFKGYEDEERAGFIDKLAQYYKNKNSAQGTEQAADQAK